MLIAAWQMSGEQLSLFALITIAAGIAFGVNRSGLLQPALVQLRNDPRAFVPFRYAITSAIAGAIIVGVSIVVLGIHDLAEVLLLIGTATLPLLADWLRFRCISTDDRWWVAAADAIRVVFVLIAILIPALASTAIGFQLYLQLSASASIVVLAFGSRRLRVWAPYRSYARAARLQLVDFLVGQANATLPLLVLGTLGPSTLIAGIRLAQTIFGPLNLVMSAAVVHLLADGATRSSHAQDAGLIASGRKLSVRLGATSLLYVIAVVVFVRLPWVEFSALDSETLLLSVSLVGAVALVSGWSGIHSIILRLLEEHVIATGGRIALVIGSILAFTIGYIAGGVVVSVIAGMLTSVFLYPLVFIVPAEFVYRRRLRR